MSHSFIKTALLACLAAGSLSAQAGTVKFAGFEDGSKTVNVALSAPNAATSFGTSAGGFATSYNGSPSFETYCVDLYQYLTPGVTYNDYSVVAATSYAFANTNAAADLGKLYSEGRLINSATTEAAFQIAIWEIVYETSGTYNLASGTAQFTGGTAADGTPSALALATTWLGALSSTTNHYTVGVLKSATQQDQVFAVTTPVPEPSTYALLAGGLFAIGFMSRRRSMTQDR